MLKLFRDSFLFLRKVIIENVKFSLRVGAVVLLDHTTSKWAESGSLSFITVLLISLNLVYLLFIGIKDHILCILVLSHNVDVHRRNPKCPPTEVVEIRNVFYDLGDIWEQLECSFLFLPLEDFDLKVIKILCEGLFKPILLKLGQ